MKTHMLKNLVLSTAMVLSLVACGGDDVIKEVVKDIPAPKKAQFVDSPVQGIDIYQGDILINSTDENGYFTYLESKPITFKVGQLTLGEATFKGFANNAIITPKNLTNDKTLETKIIRLLQSLDKDNNPDNGIVIDKDNGDKPIAKLPNQKLADISVEKALENTVKPVEIVSEANAKAHFEKTLQKIQAQQNNQSQNANNVADKLVGTWRGSCSTGKHNGKPKEADIAIFTVTKINDKKINIHERYQVFENNYKACTGPSHIKDDGSAMYDITKVRQVGNATHITLNNELTIVLENNTLSGDGGVFQRQ